MTRTVPKLACQFLAPMTVADAQTVTDGKVPVSLKARQAGPMTHWYWGPIVHDLDGMAHAAKIAIDYNHGQPIGYADQFSRTEYGLELAGALIPLGPPAEDRAAEVVAKAAAGIPYQASIDWSQVPPRLEDVPAGRTAMANGQTMTGPLTIVRQWNLAAVAICPLGADPSTETRFSESMQDTMEVSVTEAKETPMAEAVAQAEATPAAPATEQPTAPVSPPAPRVFSADEFARIVTDFGAEAAAKAVADGGDYNTAMRFALDGVRAENTELRERLAALTASGGTPAGFVAKDGAKKSLSSLFPNPSK